MKKVLSNTLSHFKKIIQHKYWVFIYCRKCGITWRGIKHDLSKFSLTEFIESIKYYKGTSSPIDECKKVNGVSYAWQHHKGRNDHHYEYWVDNLDSEMTLIEMPCDCAVEMLCDFLGAGRAYSGEKFTYEGELRWWMNKLETKPSIYYTTKYFISFMLFSLYKDEKYKEGKNIDKILKQSKIKYEVFSKNVSMNQHKILINKIKECLNEQ